MGRRSHFTKFGIVTCIAILQVGCGGKVDLGSMSEDVGPTDLRECETKMQLILPVTAEPVGIWRTKDPTETVKLKFTLPVRDLNTLLTSSPFKGERLSKEQPGMFGPNMQWWDPGPPKELKVATTQLDDGSELSIGVAEIKGGKLEVFLAWIGA